MSIFEHQHVITVYYSDTDAGRVYFANYLTFMEKARQEMLKHMGFSFPMFVYAHCDVMYKAPAVLGDTLNVVTQVTDTGFSKLDLKQKIFRDISKAPLVEMTSTLAYVNESGRPQRIPADLRMALEAVCAKTNDATPL